MSLRAIGVNLGMLQASASAALLVLAPPMPAQGAQIKPVQTKPAHAKPAQTKTLDFRAMAQLSRPHGKARPAIVAQPLKWPEFSSAAWPKDDRLKALFKPRLASSARPVQGLGLFAMAKGHSADLTEPDRWADDSEVGANDTRVGLGWRKSNVSAMFGYMRPDFSRDPYAPEVADHAEYLKPRSSVGLSIALRYH